MRNIHKALLSVGIAVILVIGIFGMMLYRAAFVPIDRNAEATIHYTIETGVTSHRITEDLVELGLVRNPTLANLVIRLNGWSHIQAGEYELSTALSLEEMFQLFEAGDIAEARHRVTIPEGERISFIADVMAPVVGLTREELIDTWNDPEFLKSLIEDYWFLTDEILNEDIYYPLEGYLYPLTYEFREEVYEVEDLTRQLLDVTAQRLEIHRESIENSRFTVHEILTLAAIIEGETQDNDEMANVSGVFHNRLEIGMRLETDVTAQYIAEERNVRVDWDMITAVSPFNTYLVAGLPPGPVNSPSIHAVEAALYPANHEFFFFISDMFNCVDGGKHYFTNFDDHIAFYEAYLLPSYEAGESVCR